MGLEKGILGHLWDAVKAEFGGASNALRHQGRKVTEAAIKTEEAAAKATGAAVIPTGRTVASMAMSALEATEDIRTAIVTAVMTVRAPEPASTIVAVGMNADTIAGGVIVANMKKRELEAYYEGKDPYTDPEYVRLRHMLYGDKGLTPAQLKIYNDKIKKCPKK